MTIEISTSVKQLVGEAKDLFHVDKRFIFYCSRGWRSALATHTAQRMELKRVGHIEGGFEAWQKAGGPVAKHEKKVSVSAIRPCACGCSTYRNAATSEATPTSSG